MRSSGIGGQAVLEGVMMKNKSDYAIAIRKPDGEISVKHGKTKSISEKSVFFRLPIIRGVVAFVESLLLGMSTLTFSAGFYEEEEEALNKTKKKDETASRKENVETVLTIMLSIVLAIGIFVVLPFFLSQLLQSKISSETVLALIEGIIRIVFFVGYIYVISFMEDINRVFMYHGAEHKSINCVENCLELTVENVRGQSKHHRRCGTSFLFIVMFISIIFFMFIHFKNVWLRMIARILLVPVIAGVSYEFIKLAGNSDSKVVAVLSTPGMLLQKLTTREPDDEMIEVAISSVEAVFDWREYQRRCLVLQSKQKEREKKYNGSKPKKSRAEIKEEIRIRERENKLRATEREFKIREMEQKEEELEKLVDDANKRKEERRRKSMQLFKEDAEDEALAGLDHYFDKDSIVNEVQKGNIIYENLKETKQEDIIGEPAKENTQEGIIDKSAEEGIQEDKISE